MGKNHGKNHLSPKTMGKTIVQPQSNPIPSQESHLLLLQPFRWTPGPRPPQQLQAQLHRRHRAPQGPQELSQLQRHGPWAPKKKGPRWSPVVQWFWSFWSHFLGIFWDFLGDFLGILLGIFGQQMWKGPWNKPGNKPFTTQRLGVLCVKVFFEVEPERPSFFEVFSWLLKVGVISWIWGIHLDPACAVQQLQDWVKSLGAPSSLVQRAALETVTSFGGQACSQPTDQTSL